MLNKNSSREKILKSALNLFSEKGYDGVGVDLIAENCGLKGPSIYKHFKFLLFIKIKSGVFHHSKLSNKEYYKIFR